MDKHTIIEKWQEECKKNIALQLENKNLRQTLSELLKDYRVRIDAIEKFLEDIVYEDYKDEDE